MDHLHKQNPLCAQRSCACQHDLTISAAIVCMYVKESEQMR